MTDIAPTTEPDATADPEGDDAQPDAPPEPEQPAQDEQGGEDDAAEQTPNSEAARYRVKLRETEAQRDALAERLAGYQRREVETVIADVLEVPGDLWEVGGADVDSFYDAEGNLKENEALGVARALADQRPRLAKPAPSWGQTSGYVPTGNGLAWSDIINQR